jgi:hypothetical protein
MDDLSRLFGEYRLAMPDPDSSADFTPGIWRRIESRRSPVRLLRRFAEALVTVAAVVAILVGVILVPRAQSSPVYSATYVDVLAAEHSTDTMAFAEVLHTEVPPESPLQ